MRALGSWWSVWINWFGLGSGKVGSVFRWAGVNGPGNPLVETPLGYRSIAVPRSWTHTPQLGEACASQIGGCHRRGEQV